MGRKTPRNLPTWIHNTLNDALNLAKDDICEAIQEHVFTSHEPSEKIRWIMEECRIQMCSAITVCLATDHTMRTENMLKALPVDVSNNPLFQEEDPNNADSVSVDCEVIVQRPPPNISCAPTEIMDIDLVANSSQSATLVNISQNTRKRARSISECSEPPLKIAKKSANPFAVFSDSKLFQFKDVKKIAFFDLETTGLRVTEARIVQICIMTYDCETGKFNEFLQNIKPDVSAVMEPDAEKLHGISLASVAREPSLSNLWSYISMMFKDSHVCGYNVLQYDLPLIAAEAKRNFLEPLSYKGTIDLMPIYSSNRRTLGNALRFYTGEELLEAHDAYADTKACVKILERIAKDDSLEPWFIRTT